jgi:tetratricopeptide (TPR) repeat protein
MDDATDRDPDAVPEPDFVPEAGALPEPGERDSAYELLQRGQALAARRHHAQAAVVLERAARLEPRRGSILEPLGRAYFMSGQLERAIETFAELLDVDPSSHYGHYALGRALVRLGRTAEGRTHLRLAVALAPDSQLYRGGLRRVGGPGGPASGAGERRGETPEQGGGAGERPGETPEQGLEA